MIEKVHQIPTVWVCDSVCSKLCQRKIMTLIIHRKLSCLKKFLDLAVNNVEANCRRLACIALTFDKEIEALLNQGKDFVSALTSLHYGKEVLALVNNKDQNTTQRFAYFFAKRDSLRLSLPTKLLKALTLCWLVRVGVKTRAVV